MEVDGGQESESGYLAERGVSGHGGDKGGAGAMAVEERGGGLMDWGQGCTREGSGRGAASLLRALS